MEKKLQGKKPYRFRQKARAFCRGLIRFRPLTEVAVQGLAEKGITQKQESVYALRVINKGSVEEVKSLLASTKRIDSGPFRSCEINIPEKLQIKALERLERIRTKKALDPFTVEFAETLGVMFTAIAGTLATCYFKEWEYVLPFFSPLGLGIVGPLIKLQSRLIDQQQNEARQALCSLSKRRDPASGLASRLIEQK